MPIIIKEIHVKTTVENKMNGFHLSQDAMAALKQRIIREITSTGIDRKKPVIKDR